MKRWCGLRLWLFLAAFACGQLVALAHGVEHLGAGEAPHVCLQCLAGHDLNGAAPPATPAILPEPPLGGGAPVAAPRSPSPVRPTPTFARGPPLA